MGEELEGRRPTKENTGPTAAARTQSRIPASYRREGVREAAHKDKKVRFTALLHHCDRTTAPEQLLRAEEASCAGSAIC